MAEILKAMKEFEEKLKENEKSSEERHAALVSNLPKCHHESTKHLTDQISKICQEMELSRGRLIERPPNYNGYNMSYDDWVENVQIIQKCNGWGFDYLLDFLPVTLLGQARMAFTCLSDADKLDEKTFFRALRLKLDPKSESRNKENFINAKRFEGESMSAFIDRCRMFIKRSGSNPEEKFSVELLKKKVFDNLLPYDQKLLHALEQLDDNLDKIVIKADSIMNSGAKTIGVVVEKGIFEPGAQKNTDETTSKSIHEAKSLASRKSRIGPCGKCRGWGHLQKYCPKKKKSDPGVHLQNI